MQKITKDAVASITFDEATLKQAHNLVEFDGVPGVEHYKLLTWLSDQFEGQYIIDIGTHHGNSALALAANGRNTIWSFDVVEKPRPQHNNITYRTVDLFDHTVREAYYKLLIDSPLIFIDIDPHEGTREFDLIMWLQANGYQGLIVVDDIWFFEGMRNNLWYKIPGKYRTDLTYLGHWSGTGIISFHQQIDHEHKADTSNWTLVTAYFDLTKMPDASDAIKARPAKHYLDQFATSTLSLDQNLIVFCEPENEEKIWKLRPTWLHQRTKVIAMSFEDFPLTKHRDTIIKNRGGACKSDPRNTASYYLLCMARYAMLKQTIASNPFGSTHFAWINICIERMGYQNLAHLDEALAVNRSKFSTCYIDYVPNSLVSNLPEYFARDACYGRCSMCSGFFTGDSYYMKWFCDAIEAEFMVCLTQGYGHADEQLFSRVYFANRSAFDWYLGDYNEMITNYAHVYSRPEIPLRQVIEGSAAAYDWQVLDRACQILHESWALGTCTLSFEQVIKLNRLRDRAAKVLKPPTEGSAKALGLGQSSLGNAYQGLGHSKTMLVTGLFDLANRDSTKRKTVDEYMQLGSFLFAINQDITFFVDPWIADRVREQRERHGLAHRTTVVAIDLEDLTCYQLRAVAEQAMPPQGLSATDTINYTLVGWSKFELIERVIMMHRDAPLYARPTHFGWVDFGVAHVADTSGNALQQAFHQPSKPVRLHMLRPFITEEACSASFWHHLQQNIAGGFFIGGTEQMHELTTKFWQGIDHALACGLRPLELDVLPYVVANGLDVTFSYGDYSELFSNHNMVQRNHRFVLREMRLLMQQHNFKLALDIALQIIKGYTCGTLQITPDQLEAVLRDAFEAATIADSKRCHGLAVLYADLVHIMPLFWKAFDQNRAWVETAFAKLAIDLNLPKEQLTALIDHTPLV